MIETRDLTRIFRTDTVETTALDKINLTIGEGEFIAIKGPSGCGKSTLLNILGLMDTPSRGVYKFMNQDTGKLSEKGRTQLRKGKIGFVFQKFNLIDSLTIYENVELPLLYLRRPAHERKERVHEVVERLGMTHRLKHYPHQLSGGQQQRTAIARCLVTNPPLVLADEPTGNLDSENGDQVMQLLKEMHDNGRTVVFVTHDDHYSSYAGRVVNLFDGKVAEGD